MVCIERVYGRGRDSIGYLGLFDACNLNKRSYIVGATVLASLFSTLKGFLFT